LVFSLASGAWSSSSLLPPPNQDEALDRKAGAPATLGPCSARDCQIRNALVIKRKQAAAPARKRHTGGSPDERRFGP
jgi:hypothetical protein